MAIRADALAIMAKAAEPGSVKTRLVPRLSALQAADLARALLVDQLAHLESCAADLYLAFAPAEAAAVMERLASRCRGSFPQQGEDLGARMHAVFAKLFGDGYRRVVLIGGDLPAVPLRFLEEAYAFLSSTRRRVALGPSADGGYYLVGCNSLTPEMFTGMHWSHNQVLAQTIEKLDLLEIEYQLVPEWFDVDTPDDLLKLRSALAASLAKAMPNTAAFFSRLDRSGR